MQKVGKEGVMTNEELCLVTSCSLISPSQSSRFRNETFAVGYSLIASLLDVIILYSVSPGGKLKIVNAHCQSIEGIRSSSNRSRSSLSHLNPRLWSRCEISLGTKGRTYQGRLVLLYGCETWPVRVAATFYM